MYQTDLPAYARAYRLGRAGEAFAWRWLRGIHNGAARTLAPSTVTATGLLAQGIGNVWLWGRGVDTERFDPADAARSSRAALAPDGELIVGYVGRLATEKRVELLAGITALDGVRLVIVGAGPAEAMLRQHMPGAVFLGERRGDELAAIYASLDVFVHSGPYETFGQTLQEAAASGLPVVAPAAGGPLDLVEDGVTGYLVPPADPDAFTAAVARLAADPARRGGVRRGGPAQGPRPELAGPDRGADSATTPRCSAAPRQAEGRRMRIVRLANFVAPRSGGLRTSLRELGAGYLAAGHEPVLIIPGARDSDQQTAQGRVITLRAPRRAVHRRLPGAVAQAAGGRPARPAAAGHASRFLTGLRCAGPAGGPARTACPPSWCPTRAWWPCSPAGAAPAGAGCPGASPTGSTGGPPAPTSGSSAPPAGPRPSSSGSAPATWSASRSAST